MKHVELNDNCTIAVEKIDTSKMSEEQQAIFVMEMLLKVLILFQNGVVLNKIKKMFNSIFPDITDGENDKRYVPLVYSATKTLVEWGWILQEKFDIKNSKIGGYYIVTSINPKKKDEIAKILKDQSYDGWLETAVNIIIQSSSKKTSPEVKKGFESFRNRLQPPNVTETDIPF
jgi:hypothetical protein